MKTFKTSIKYLLMSGMILSAFNCKDNDGIDDGEGGASNQFFIAATQDAATYFITADDLESGTASIVGKGIELPSTFTHLVNGTNNAITALAYKQGDPGKGISFKLNENGKLVKLSNEFSLTDGYNTVGVFENYIVAGRNATLASTGAIGANFYFVDQATGNVSEKEFDSRVVSPTTAPLFSGILDKGNGEFLSAYTKEANNVDSVWVASFDKDFKLKRVYKDNRISYSTGRWKSARYSQIANDDTGNTYVFSGSYEATTTKPAGVIRINKGATTFDASYYFNIQEKSGGYRFRKVWHAVGDYFLLEMYNISGAITNSSTATQYAIVNAVTKDFKWITSGFPSKEQITSVGWPLSYNGKVYFPVVSSANSYPVVYSINPSTAVAKAGLVIQSEGVLGVGFLKK